MAQLPLVRRTKCLHRRIEPLEFHLPVSSSSEVARSSEGDSELAVLLGPGLSDSTLLGNTTVLWGSAIMVSSSSPPGVCLHSQQ